MKDEKTADKRITPQSDLDYNMLITNTTWDSNQLSSEIKEALRRYRPVFDENGKVKLDEEGRPVFAVWEGSEKLRILTRDTRLSNLNGTDYAFCNWWDSFAGGVNILGDFPRSTAYCLYQRDSRLNLAQSLKGWFRRIQATLFNENRNINEEPKKKSLFGGGAQ